MGYLYTSDVDVRSMHALIRVARLSMLSVRFRHVVYDKAEIRIVEPVLYVLLLSREKVIDNGNFVPLHHQLVGEVTSNESCSP